MSFVPSGNGKKMKPIWWKCLVDRPPPIRSQLASMWHQSPGAIADGIKAIFFSFLPGEWSIGWRRSVALSATPVSASTGTLTQAAAHTILKINTGRVKYRSTGLTEDAQSKDALTFSWSVIVLEKQRVGLRCQLETSTSDGWRSNWSRNFLLKLRLWHTTRTRVSKGAFYNTAPSKDGIILMYEYWSCACYWIKLLVWSWYLTQAFKRNHISSVRRKKKI